MQLQRLIKRLDKYFIYFNSSNFYNDLTDHVVQMKPLNIFFNTIPVVIHSIV